LAWSLAKAGRNDEALRLAEETAAHYTERYQPHDPNALLCMMTLAAAIPANAPTRRNDGHERRRAVQTARLALSGLEDRFGALHPNTLACANNAAVYERRAGHA